MSAMLLTWVFNGKPLIVFNGDVRICQSKKMAFSKEAQWKKGFFQIRTPEGFKAVPILIKKFKTRPTL